MKMVNIGYVSLIPQDLEGILEELLEGGGGSGGSGGVILSVDDNDGLIGSDEQPVSYTDLVQLASESICCLVGVASDSVTVGYLTEVYHDVEDGYIARFTFVSRGEGGSVLATETYIAETADAQLIAE